MTLFDGQDVMETEALNRARTFYSTGEHASTALCQVRQTAQGEMETPAGRHRTGTTKKALCRCR